MKNFISPIYQKNGFWRQGNQSLIQTLASLMLVKLDIFSQRKFHVSWWESDWKGSGIWLEFNWNYELLKFEILILMILSFFCFPKYLNNLFFLCKLIRENGNTWGKSSIYLKKNIQINKFKKKKNRNSKLEKKKKKRSKSYFLILSKSLFSILFFEKKKKKKNYNHLLKSIEI